VLRVTQIFQNECPKIPACFTKQLYYKIALRFRKKHSKVSKKKKSFALIRGRVSRFAIVTASSFGCLPQFSESPRTRSEEALTQKQKGS
jgi:hypothetical protein